MNQSPKTICLECLQVLGPDDYNEEELSRCCNYLPGLETELCPKAPSRARHDFPEAEVCTRCGISWRDSLG